MKRLSLGRYALSICVVTAMLAGCGGSQPPIGAPGAYENAIQSHAFRRFDVSAPPLLNRNTGTPGYKVTGPLLYVVNFDAPPYDAVTIYDAKTNDPSPIAVINKDLFLPNGDCVDSDGTLYVGNDPASSGWISEYALGQTEPSRIITKGIDGPAFCAIDSAGDLWVANNGGAPNVTEYLKGSTKPHATIKNGLTSPIGIAIDHAGNMYVGNHVLYGTTNVQVYPPGSKSPSRTITDGVTWPVGIAVDTKGTLYVTNDNGVSSPCNVEEYRAGKNHPYRAITDEINGPTVATFGKKGWLFEVNEGTQGCSGPAPVILEFPPGSTTPSNRMISKDLHVPVGAAYYPPQLP